MRPILEVCAAALAVALLLGAGACGSASEEELLAAADLELTGLREEVRGAQRNVDDAEARLGETQTELENARAELAAVRDRLTEAESRVDLTATDALLFRAIQRRLLEEPELEHVAIRATVERGVVTLSGAVPDESTRERAMAAVGEFPGLVAVVDRMSVEPVVEAAPAGGS